MLLCLPPTYHKDRYDDPHTLAQGHSVPDVPDFQLLHATSHLRGELHERDALAQAGVPVPHHSHCIQLALGRVRAAEELHNLLLLECMYCEIEKFYIEFIDMFEYDCGP